MSEADNDVIIGQFMTGRLDAMVRGWFVGDFDPTIVKTSAVEVAVQHYAAGAVEACHVHRVATEITVIVSGRARMSGKEFGPGDIVRIEPGVATDFHALDDTVTVVVKLPSVRGDKYPVLSAPEGAVGPKDSNA